MKLNYWLNNLPEYIPGKTLEEIKKKYGLKKVYKLASNENMFGPHPKVIEYIRNNAEDINYYPDSDCREIRERLSSKYHVSMDNIIIGNGTDQIIELICDGFTDRDSNIIVAHPTFLIYEKSALKNGGEVIKVPLVDFRQDVCSMVGRINGKTKILFLTSPHNPTGTIINKKEFDYVLENVDKKVLIVVDEAYWEYAPEDERVNTSLYLDRNPNLVILRTFSKIYGLAGLRIGYGISSHGLVSVLNRIRLPFSVNSIAQKAAVVALDHEEYTEEIYHKTYKEKQKFYSAFEKMGIDYVKSYSNFILVKIGEKSREVSEDLLKKGFIIRPGENLGIEGYIRVTMSLPEVNDRFLEVFSEIYSKYKFR